MADISRRVKLFTRNPHCHWCKRLTQLHQVGYGQKTPEDNATVDHLYWKGQPLRSKPRSKVLACFKCNNERGAQPEWVKAAKQARMLAKIPVMQPITPEESAKIRNQTLIAPGFIQLPTPKTPDEVFFSMEIHFFRFKMSFKVTY